MGKIEKYSKQSLILFLVVVFLNPLFIKTIHIFVVHHEHAHFSFSGKPEISNHYDKCPICEYKFVKLIGNDGQIFIKAFEFYWSYLLPPVFEVIIDFPDYSFQLRAPPVTHFS